MLVGTLGVVNFPWDVGDLDEVPYGFPACDMRAADVQELIGFAKQYNVTATLDSTGTVNQMIFWALIEQDVNGWHTIRTGFWLGFFQCVLVPIAVINVSLASSKLYVNILCECRWYRLDVG